MTLPFKTRIWSHVAAVQIRIVARLYDIVLPNWEAQALNITIAQGEENKYHNNFEWISLMLKEPYIRYWIDSGKGTFGGRKLLRRLRVFQ